jgi:hypothetical protein
MRIFSWRTAHSISAPALILFCAAQLLVTGCGKTNELAGQVPLENIRGVGLSIWFDPGLTSDLRQMAEGDLGRLQEFKMAVPQDSVFREMFGGGKASDVLSYIDDRVNYLIPRLDDVESRIVTDSILSTGFQATDPGRPMVMASNIGMPLWLIHEIDAPQSVHFLIGGNPIDLSNPHVGIVMLGEGYSDQVPSMARIGTLVHEARHSDCTGGLSRSDLAKVRDNELPDNHACGHIHVNCPAGHDYEGLPACDSHPWGAYSVGAYFYAAIAQDCTNCTSEELQYATMLASDSISRVLVAEDMIEGKLGRPDMSSSGLQ